MGVGTGLTLIFVFSWKDYHGIGGKLPNGGDCLKSCLNVVTTGDPGIREFAAIASKSGFEGIEYSIEPIQKLVDEDGLDYAKTLIDGERLSLASFFLPVNFHQSDEIFESSLAQLERYAKTAAELKCARCCTWLMPGTNNNPVDQLLTCILRLRKCAVILRDHGISLGIEFVGPHCKGTNKYDYVGDLGTALRVGEALDIDGTGVLFDSFHWFTSGGTSDQLLKVPANRITLVHINDAPDKDRLAQVDSERLLPGEGVIDLSAMLNGLKAIKYEGYVSVEVFSKELTSLGFEKAASLAKQAFDIVMDKTGV